MKHQIKQPNELSDNEIECILQLWEVSEWNTMKPDYFRNFFKDSEFHLLLDTNETILAIIRVNFDFTLKISEKEYSFAEVVGFVATHRKKGHGSRLIQHFIENLRERNMETIGFCHSELRPFYEKCEIEILYDKAKMIMENIDSEWINSDDDDILIFKVSEKRKKLLSQLSTENNAYLITKE